MSSGTAVTRREGPMGMVEQEQGVASVSVAATKEAEIKAAIVMARNLPRREDLAFASMQRAAERPRFAEKARYVFPRGGSTIIGPSVNLAREMARCWGNLKYGTDVLEITKTQVHLRGWAWDLETNTYVSEESRVGKLQQRVNRSTGETEWVEPDERDLRELIARHGAVLHRNALLRLMPADIVDDLMDQCERTLKKAARGDLKQDRKRLIRYLVSAFEYHGVRPEMLEARIGHPLDQITPEEVAELKALHVAIEDGQTRVGEVFQTAAGQVQQDSKASALDGRVAAEAPEPEQATDEEDEAPGLDI